MPVLLAQQFDEVNRRTRRRRHENRSAVQISNVTVRKDGDTAHRAVTRYRQIRKQVIVLGIPSILHRRHHRHVQLSRSKQIVQLAGRTRHKFTGERHNAPVDGPVHGIAVDVPDPSNAHHTLSVPTSRVSS